MTEPKNPRKARTGANALAFAALALGAIAAVNVISTRLFGRLDLTEERIYTLSPESRRLVAQLPDRMTVKAYISRELPPEPGPGGISLATSSQYLRDLLDEYAAYSGGKLAWEAVDPEGDKKLAEEAERNKVRKLQVYVRKTGKRELGEKYLGVSFQYQGNVEALAAVTGVEGLEYQLTSIIKRMTVRKKKLVFTSGHGELELGKGLQVVRQNLQDYDVVSANLGGEKAQELPADADAVFVVGPRRPLSEPARRALDQALMRGVPVAYFVDGMLFEPPQQQMPGMPAEQQLPNLGRKNEHGLDEQLRAYGVKVGADVALDLQVALGPLPYQGRMVALEYPTFVATTKLAEQHPALRKVKALVFPFASTVDLLGKGAGATRLAQTTERAWRRDGFFLVDPRQRLTPTEDRGPFTMAVALAGRLPSAFAGDPAPAPQSTPEGGDDPAAAAPPRESVGTARLLVVGSSKVISDEYLQLAQALPVYRGNLLFFWNVVSWLTEDDSLSVVRAKGLTARPITLTEGASGPLVAKVANVVGLPALLILLGILKWRVRRARRLALRL